MSVLSSTEHKYTVFIYFLSFCLEVMDIDQISSSSVSNNYVMSVLTGFTFSFSFCSIEYGRTAEIAHFSGSNYISACRSSNSTRISFQP